MKQLKNEKNKCNILEKENNELMERINKLEIGIKELMDEKNELQVNLKNTDV